MNALKLIYDDLPPVIEMPREYQHHSVQIVITPLAGVMPPDEEAAKKPAPWLARFAGKWQGEPLVREDEGCYEVRDDRNHAHDKQSTKHEAQGRLNREAR